MASEKNLNSTRMRLKPHEVAVILKMRGEASKDTPDYGVKHTELKDNEMTQVLLSPENFKTTEDMAAYCKIDTSIWKVAKIISNFWGSSTNPCWQFKVWWQKREDAFIDTKEIDWKYILGGIEKKDITDTRYLTGIKATRGHFDRLVITDHHIGMDTNKNGFSLFGGKWGEKELFERMQEIANHCYLFQASDVLYIDDLGDLMDGWDAKTCRKGHELPQNMDNQKAFDVALKYKRILTEILLGHYRKIIWHNVVADNHSGSFGYVVNSAFKTLAEGMYKGSVEVINQRKFVDHYKVDNNIFLLCHGKDEENLKFGYPNKLEGPKGKEAIDKINSYIDHHELWSKDAHIEFSKGNDHQENWDKSSSERFYYYSYWALSPSSNWVQTNYKKGKSGFTLFNYWDKDRPWFSTASSIQFKWED